jgi:hypothetical protein
LRTEGVVEDCWEKVGYYDFFREKERGSFRSHFHEITENI